ncbi:MAG: ABC transporter ATP-binding protein [Verrucomicrobiae bacterium]|nr:ABC transporter ATP-binding protein [Verrucomicrobiae bacterium]
MSGAPQNAGIASLEVEGVERVFRAGAREVHVLRGVTHRFDVGRLTTIQGASGSGKSTLLHIIGGLDRPDAGSVRVDGSNLYATGRDGLARYRNRRVGMIFQAYHLMPDLTALENVALPGLIGGRVETGRARELLAAVGLGDRATHLPGELSGGEQQRVAIARALINEPDLLLADEPTGNLDSAAGASVLELMLDLLSRRGLTAVLVTHDAGVASKGHRRLRLADGLLCEE